MASGTGEKTEQPTEKRLKEARKQGQFARSQDLTSSLLLIATVIVVWTFGGYFGNFFQNSIKEQIEFAAGFKGQFTKEIAQDVLLKASTTMFWILAPIFIVSITFALFGNFLQVGSIFAFRAVTPKFERLNPNESLRQNFLNLSPYIEIGKTILRISITVIIAGFVLWQAREDLVRLIFKPSDIVLAYTFRLLLEICLKIGIVFLILGILDFFLQRYLNRRSLKMTKQEIREENKETEGNPLIRSRRKTLHREVLSQNLRMAVKNSDVVLANPTHISVAIKYDKNENDAPIITAKGADLMAAHIRQLANEANVPIRHDPQLARTLFEFEVGNSIPEEFYEDVAAILQWVYSLNNFSLKT